MYKSQYGFRANHSTELAGIEFVDKILHYLDDQHTPISIFLDLSKAFDTLDHDILLFKLKHYGITGTPYKWFYSYLSNRQHYTQYACPKDWKSRQWSLKVLSLDPCCSLSIWTTFIPYQIHFKQYGMQMTQRLRLLSVHLPVWWLVYKKYLVISRLSYLISICGWQRTGFLSILIKQGIWFFILVVAKWTIFLKI